MLSGSDLKSNINSWNNWNERAQRQALQQIAVNTGIIADQLYISNSIARAQLELEFSEQMEEFQERYYKDQTFKAVELHEELTEIEHPVLRYHFFYSVQGTMDDLQNAKGELDEIDDKKVAKDTLNKLEDMEQELATHRESYRQSPFPKFYDLIGDYENIEAGIRKAPWFMPTGMIHKTSKIRLATIICLIGFVASGIFLFWASESDKWGYTVRTNKVATFFFCAPLALFGYLLFKQLKNYLSMQRYLNDKARHDRLVADIEQETKNIRERLDAHPLFKHLDGIKREYPEYVRHLNKFKNIENGFRERWITKQAEMDARRKKLSGMGGHRF